MGEPWGLLWVGFSCLCMGHFQLPPSPCQGWEHCDCCQAGRAKTPCPGLPVLFSLSWSPLPVTYCQVRAYTIRPRCTLLRATAKQLSDAAARKTGEPQRGG